MHVRYAGFTLGRISRAGTTRITHEHTHARMHTRTHARPGAGDGAVHARRGAVGRRGPPRAAARRARLRRAALVLRPDRRGRAEGPARHAAVRLGQHARRALEQGARRRRAAARTRAPRGSQNKQTNKQANKQTSERVAPGRQPRARWAVQAVGEPPFFLAACTFLALKDAVVAARAANGVHGRLRLDSPLTAARIRMACADRFSGGAREYRASGSY
jgi:hypothetical protein